MEKIVRFLEKNVEWVALAIGGLFLLGMVWTYVLNKPVFVTMGSDNLTPGEIDNVISENSMKQLEDSLHSLKKPEIEVTQFDTEFKNNMAGPKTVPLLAGGWTAARGGNAISGGGGIVGDQPQLANGPDKLPVPPAATFVAQSSGRSTVNIPMPGGNAQPNAQPVMASEDKQWWSAKFLVDMKALDKAFTDAKIPPAIAGTTMFLQVEVVRQEELPGGEYGPETNVPALVTQVLQPMPDEKAGQGAQLQFVDWASKNTEMIIHPTFYTVVKGDLWQMPGGAAVANPDAERRKAEAEAKKAAEDEKKRLEAEERQRKIDEAKNRSKQPKTPTRKGPGGGPGGMTPYPGGGGTPGGGGYPQHQIRDDSPRIEVAQANPGGVYDPSRPGGGYRPPYQTGGYPGYPGNPGGAYPGMPGGGYNPAAQNPQVGMAAGPVGAFNPAQVANVEILVHDDSAEAGKSYRYKVRYKLRNPLFQTFNIAKVPALANQLAIASEWSVWTAPVTFPSRTNFWLAANQINRAGQVKIDVFSWKSGEQRKKQYQVAPGDSIGDGDFVTGKTLVDTLQDADSGYIHILLTDDNGGVTRRDFTSDSTDTEYKTLLEQAVQPPADEPAASAVGAHP